MKKPVYYYVHLDVAADKVEDFSMRLFDLGAQGLEERDEHTLEKGPTGKVTLVASFESKEAAEAARAKMPKLVAARIVELVGDEWRDAWKEHFKPFLL